jgi:hypothetical protein
MPHYFTVYDGHVVTEEGVLLATFCGYVLLETVYTKYNQGMLKSVATSSVDTYINVSYHIHVQGHAHRFHGTQFKQPDFWELSLPRTPAWVYFVHNLVQYVWYFAFPAFPHYNVKPLDDADDKDMCGDVLQMKPYIHKVCLRLINFTCSHTLDKLLHWAVT